MAYNFTAIEKKWQQYWLEHKTFRTLDPAEAGGKPNSYVLDMFPYPSGSGLHVGHPEGYTATDIVARYLRMCGRNVLHPMGWDAFGLPAEQYAIQHNTHPRETTEKNIATFRRQIQMLGLSYDWDREINTTDPKYYKWTQWIFLQLFNSYFDATEQAARPIAHLLNELFAENRVVAPDGEVVVNPTQEGLEEISGDVRVERLWRELDPEEQRAVIDGQRLAYIDEMPVNWCPALGTVLANEEIIDGRSERGGYPVERRPMRQWMLRITAYSDRLLQDLEDLEWPESLKDMQRNWIGRSVGAEVEFPVAPPDEHVAAVNVARGEDPPDTQDATIAVFTTRPDTLYGATYLVLAPEHELVDQITPDAHRETVEAYRAVAAAKSERDRITEGKEKTGIFSGAYAINPVNDERIPIYIADYVLTGYGTGAIMAVPAHDERDFEFARKFNLPIRTVVAPPDNLMFRVENAPYLKDGIALDSDPINGMATPNAKERMIEFIENLGYGKRSVNYKLRDWLFSRQRYWGEPFPILLDEQDNPYAVPEDQLPVVLPELSDFKPTGTPEPPLSKAKDWLNVTIDGRQFRRETNTMPQWAGSCWYYLRYTDPHNDRRFADPEKEKYWLPVDLYVGGVEHAVLHLLYSRFWHKVLFDLGHVSTPEPFRRLVNQGLILGETEYYAFRDDAGAMVSAADVTDIKEEATSDGPRMGAVRRDSSHRLIGARVSEEEVEKASEGFRLKANPSIRVDARSFKMSKARGNVVNPDDIVRDYGADAFRLYEMYLGPLEAQKPWGTRDIIGMLRFLNSVWRNLVGDDSSDGGDAATVDAGTIRHADVAALTGQSNVSARIAAGPIPDAIDRQLHRTIRKVAEDIKALRFNTAIAELIKLNNAMSGLESIPRELAEKFTLMLAPFAPHIAEELWMRLGHEGSLAYVPWPAYDTAKLVETTLELPIQVNGKMRDKIVVPADFEESQILEAAALSEKVRPWLAGKTVRKRLYVPKKLVNFVVS